MERVVLFKRICVLCGSNSSNRTVFGEAALGGRLRLVKFERRRLDDCLDFIKSKMYINGYGSVAGLSNGNVTIKATGGTRIGGGTIFGLAKLLSGCTSYDEFLRLSQRGDNLVLELIVKDICRELAYQKVFQHQPLPLALESIALRA